MNEDERPRSVTHPTIEAAKRHPVVKVLLLVLPALVSSLAAYTGASDDAKTEAQVVKNKAESGYQVAKGALEDLQERVARLELRMEEERLKRAIRAGSRRSPASVAPPPPTAPAPVALPANLDKALERTPAPAEVPAP